MKPFFMFTLLFFLPLLFACQSNNDNRNDSQKLINTLYLDQKFTKPLLFEIESEQDVFMLDHEMLALVNEKLKNSYSPKRKQICLP
jgi:hypothetical protein